MGQEQGSLAEIVQHQGRQNDEEPGHPDRDGTEMAEIRVEGLAARHGEKHGREDGKRHRHIRMDHEGERISRVDRGHHSGRGDDAAEPEQAENREPDQHEGSEDPADPAGAHALHGKQRHQNGDGDRQHVRLELLGTDGEAFDGAQDGNGGRDRAVRVEQGRAHKAEHRQVDAPGTGLNAPYAQKGEQRDDAALAAIVGAEDEQAVLDRNDDEERPQDEGQNPHHRLSRQDAVACGHGRLPQRVERAGADIAEHDSQGAEDDRPRGDSGSAVVGMGVSDCGHDGPNARRA